jgi:hypothetical protein
MAFVRRIVHSAKFNSGNSELHKLSKYIILVSESTKKPENQHLTQHRLYFIFDRKTKYFNQPVLAMTQKGGNI